MRQSVRIACANNIFAGYQRSGADEGEGAALEIGIFLAIMNGRQTANGHVLPVFRMTTVTPNRSTRQSLSRN